MKLSSLIEATREFEKKLIDPALMTNQEYHAYLNPKQKTHPSESYQWSMKQYREWSASYMAYDLFKTLINARIVKGKRFELRMRTTSNWTENKYVKSGPDGWGLRDEQDNPIYMSQDDLRASNIPEFDYAFCIYNEERLPVASAQNEWDCWLFGVAIEYRGYGFGPWIGGVARDKIPDRTSGGFTMSGARNLDKIHEKLVRDYLSSGFYSWLVRSKQISLDRVKEILKSVNNAMRWNEISRRNGYYDTSDRDGNNPSRPSKVPNKKLDLIRVPEPELDTPDNKEFWGKYLPDHYRMESFSLNEAPLVGYDYLSDPSSDPEKNRLDPNTSRLAQSPKAKIKAERMFQNTPYKIRVIFYENRQFRTETGEKTNLYTGRYDLESLLIIFPGVKPMPGVISFIIATDNGDDFVPFTPWMIAHRLGHAVAIGAPSIGQIISGLRHAIDLIGAKVFLDSHSTESMVLPGIAGFLGKFKSARDRTFNNLGEFLMDCFAQYLIQGRVSFNRFNPGSQVSSYADYVVNGDRNTTKNDYRDYPNPNRDQTVEISPDKARKLNPHVIALEKYLNDAFTKQLSSMLGTVWVI